MNNYSSKELGQFIEKEVTYKCNICNIRVSRDKEDIEKHLKENCPLSPYNINQLTKSKEHITLVDYSFNGINFEGASFLTLHDQSKKDKIIITFICATKGYEKSRTFKVKGQTNFDIFFWLAMNAFKNTDTVFDFGSWFVKNDEFLKILIIQNMDEVKNKTTVKYQEIMGIMLRKFKSDGDRLKVDIADHMVV